MARNDNPCVRHLQGHVEVPLPHEPVSEPVQTFRILHVVSPAPD